MRFQYRAGEVDNTLFVPRFVKMVEYARELSGECFIVVFQSAHHPFPVANPAAVGAQDELVEDDGELARDEQALGGVLGADQSPCP